MMSKKQRHVLTKLQQAWDRNQQNGYCYQTSTANCIYPKSGWTAGTNCGKRKFFKKHLKNKVFKKQYLSYENWCIGAVSVSIQNEQKLAQNYMNLNLKRS